MHQRGISGLTGWAGSYELIVVDDGSWDDAAQRAERAWPHLRLVRHERRAGTATAKHSGARAAAGALLVFLDAHCRPEPGAIQRLVAALKLLDGAALVTPAIVALDQRSWQPLRGRIGHGYRFELVEFRSEWLGLSRLRRLPGPAELYETPAAIGCAFAISRWLYDELLGLDRHLRSWGLEDLDLSLKCWLAGYRIVHEPAALIAHRFQSRFSYPVPPADYVANQLRVAYKHFGDGPWRAWLAAARARYAGVADDTVLEQEEYSYDEAGNLLQATRRQRYHNAAGTGELADPDAEPRARV